VYANAPNPINQSGTCQAYTGWAKKRGHSTFSQIFTSKLQNTTCFCKHQGCCMVNMSCLFNMRVYSFYYLKWRHLVNRLPLDNATLKLQNHGVGQCLVHRKDERWVYGTADQGQQSVLLMRRFFLAKGYCIRANAAITSGHCSEMARRLKRPIISAIHAKMSGIFYRSDAQPSGSKQLNLKQRTKLLRGREVGL